MDLDASLKSHGSRLTEIEGFVMKVKEMIEGGDSNVEKATDQLDGLLAFKSEIEAALPEIRKAIADANVLAGDIAAIRSQLEPIVAWVEQQKAATNAGPAEPSADPAAAEHPAEEIPHSEADPSAS